MPAQSARQVASSAPASATTRTDGPGQAPAVAAVPASGGSAAGAGGGSNTAAAVGPQAGDLSGGGATASSADGGDQSDDSGADSSQSDNGIRRVYARPGDDITIGLRGDGWIFTGGPSGGNEWKGGITYNSKSSDANGTTFSFTGKSLGEWELQFVQQNPATGTSTTRVVDVDIVDEAQFADLLRAAQPSAGGNTAASSVAAKPGDLATAEKLLKQGRLTQALTEFERAWKPGDPALNDRIANLAFQVGQYQDAKAYWTKNLNAKQGTYAELAVDGVMKSSTELKDAPELKGMFDQVQAITQIPISTDLLDAGRFLEQAQDWQTAQEYLGEFLKRYPAEPGADAACYLLGQMYQKNTPLQDVRAAIGYYRQIVDDFPTSEYYDLAQANIVYLNRNYFQIR